MHLSSTVYPEYDGGSEVLEYEVEVTYPDGSSRIAFKGNRTDCVVAGLSPGRQYQFRVRAYNKVGVSITSSTYFKGTTIVQKSHGKKKYFFLPL